MSILTDPLYGAKTIEEFDYASSASYVETNEDAQRAIANGERPKDDVYPTPEWLVTSALLRDKHSQSRKNPLVIDAGAGDGVWGTTYKHLFPLAYVAGVELRPLDTPKGFDEWYVGKYEDYQPSFAPDLIIGNPPYTLAEAFIRKSMDLLKIGGELMFLLPLQFLGGQAKAEGLFQQLPMHCVSIISKRPSFSGNKKTDSREYAMFHWVKVKDPSLLPVWLSWMPTPEELKMKRFRKP